MSLRLDSPLSPAFRRKHSTNTLSSIHERPLSAVEHNVFKPKSPNVEAMDISLRAKNTKPSSRPSSALQIHPTLRSTSQSFPPLSKLEMEPKTYAEDWDVSSATMNKSGNDSAQIDDTNCKLPLIKEDDFPYYPKKAQRLDVGQRTCGDEDLLEITKTEAGRQIELDAFPLKNWIDRLRRKSGYEE